MTSRGQGTEDRGQIKNRVCLASSVLHTLKKRPEFLAVAATQKKWVAPGLLLQLGPVKPEPALRYGLTATTKIGNAVIRNRARRRLRALAFEILPAHASPLHDYVLIARAATATRDYAELRRDLMTALKKLGVWQDKGQKTDVR